MKVYKRGDNGEILMHSDTYLGEDYTSPNMMHWKYIKREWKNGHYVYTYEDPTDTMHNDYVKYNKSITKDFKKDIKENIKRHNEFTRFAKNDLKNGKAFKAFQNMKTAKNNAEYAAINYGWIKKYKQDLKDENDSYKKETNKAIYKIRKAIGKTTAKVLTKASSLVNKGKKALKKLFG